MNITIEKNKLDNFSKCWFELGISWMQLNGYNKGRKYMITIGLSFWTLYIRYGHNK
jgi:hypothetical protein